MNTYFKNIYLVISGLTLLAVGGVIALIPQTYLTGLGFSLDIAASSIQPISAFSSTNMMSDLRGMGGMLLFIGGFVFISIFRKPWQSTALMVSVLVYAAFVVFRSIGFVIDGFPSEALVAAYTLELILAMTGASLMKIQSLLPEGAK